MLANRKLVQLPRLTRSVGFLGPTWFDVGTRGDARRIDRQYRREWAGLSDGRRLISTGRRRAARFVGRRSGCVGHFSLITAEGHGVPYLDAGRHCRGRAVIKIKTRVMRGLPSLKDSTFSTKDSTFKLKPGALPFYTIHR